MVAERVGELEIATAGPNLPWLQLHRVGVAERRERGREVGDEVAITGEVAEGDDDRRLATRERLGVVDVIGQQPGRIGADPVLLARP